MLPALDVDDVCAIYVFLICNTYSMQIGRQLKKSVFLVQMRTISVCWHASAPGTKRKETVSIT